MENSVQMNLRVLPETRDRVHDMANKTFRSKSDLIDWLVSEAYTKMFPNSISNQDDPSNSSQLSE